VSQKMRKPRRSGWIRPKPRERRVLWRSGRVIEDARGMYELRRRIFKRAEGKCEVIKANGKRCNAYAKWDGIGKGDLSHIKHGAKGPGDVDSNVLWSCRECHSKRHPGPQFGLSAERRQSEDAGAHPQGPA
jgi:hypothetical protein